MVVLKTNTIMQQQQWQYFNGTPIKQPIEEAVRQALLKEKAAGNTIKVCIGTDSQVKSRETAFATVIVFVRQGKGAFMYICNQGTKRKMPVKERMLKEVACSIDVAYRLCQLFIAFNVHLEVHADINTNPNFKSNTALKEAMGYIMGMGFAFKAKPHAFASSDCADRMVH
jgi:predicted RNase H-related nuclease YkuK (DUF458 family)